MLRTRTTGGGKDPSQPTEVGLDLRLLDVEALGVSVRREQPAHPLGDLLYLSQTIIPCDLSDYVTFTLPLSIGSGHRRVLESH